MAAFLSKIMKVAYVTEGGVFACGDIVDAVSVVAELMVISLLRRIGKRGCYGVISTAVF